MQHGNQKLRRRSSTQTPWFLLLVTSFVLSHNNGPFLVVSKTSAAALVCDGEDSLCVVWVCLSVSSNGKQQQQQQQSDAIPSDQSIFM